MIEINRSKEASASVDSVWKLVSDLDNENNYWPPFKDAKILSRRENALEREVIMMMGGGHMGNSKSLQILVIDPAQRSSTLSLNKGIPRFAGGFVKDHMSHFTEKALAKILEDAENPSRASQ